MSGLSIVVTGQCNGNLNCNPGKKAKTSASAVG